METILIAFVDTLDQVLKKLQQEAGDRSGFANLTINQLHYIDAIDALGEPTISEIAEKLRITRASVTIGVNKLIQLGYVEKNQSAIDRRVFHVRLTDPAQRLIQARFQALRDYGDLIRAALSEEEARQFERTLTKIVQLFPDQSPPRRHA